MLPDKIRDQLKNDYPILFERVKVFWIGPGWVRIVQKIADKLDFLSESLDVNIYATEVKEKFGALKFYIDVEESSHLTDDDRYLLKSICADVAAQAEILSRFICAQCGENYTERLTFGARQMDICPKCAKDIPEELKSPKKKK